MTSTNSLCDRDCDCNCAQVVTVDPRRADSLQYCAQVINAAPKHLDVVVVLGFRDCRGPDGSEACGITVEQVEQVCPTCEISHV